ncbi:MAG TPA: hypothetical protein VM925_30110 [Labilithrix sp.]|nr:hypothetical protein [Labilithrix sp.]
MRSEPVKNTRDPRQLELPVGGQRGHANGEVAERAAAIVESLPKLSGEEVFAAFEELDQLPSEVVRDALATSTGPAPDPEQLDDATRRAHGFPPRPLRLRTLAVVNDADIFDLGSVAEEQLRLAGKAWDGADLSAEERLDGESEGSFAGTLAHRVLADADAAGVVPLFDVLLYAEDAGSIFRAGTTDLVGAIAYGIVEMKDKRARVAIQEALAIPFEEPSVFEPEPVEIEGAISAPAPAVAVSTPSDAFATKKRAAASKTKTTDAASKKAGPAKAPTKKKTATKELAPKTSAGAKKSAAKKKVAAETKKTAAPKKPVKAPAPKKPSAKKAAAKTGTAKKTAAAAVTSEKSASKKTAKKAGAKKAGAKKRAVDE